MKLKYNTLDVCTLCNRPGETYFALSAEILSFLVNFIPDPGVIWCRGLPANEKILAWPIKAVFVFRFSFLSFAIDTSVEMKSATFQ